MMIDDYRDLIVWQKSMCLVTEIYNLSKSFPNSEVYGLSSQMRRAAVSIPSNIAEGQQRNSIKDFINFLSIAKGSCAELQTQLLISVNLDYLTKMQIESTLELCNEVSKMLTSLINKLKPIK